VSPFSEWSLEAPTRSLAWYHAYNEVKHDRERHFKSATLANALSAVSAVLIICLAEFGPVFLPKTRAFEVFSVTRRPYWSIGDTHGDANGQNQGRPLAYPFQ
jgi:hypothetical protein